MILDTVARDLSTFSWCKVLLSCIADAVEVTQQVYNASILHHDLNSGNIMIVRDNKTQEWRGLLIDWDMCLRKHEDGSCTGRTGTWAFLPARLIPSDNTPNNTPESHMHTPWDDIESAFWVLVYEALLYLKYRDHSVHYIMHLIFFEHIRLTTGLVVGRGQKMNVFIVL